MSDDISKEDLQKQIHKILKNADLAKTSTKKVIQKLEETLGVDLTDKKKIIDKMVMDYVDSIESEKEEEEEEEPKPKKKKPAPKKKETKGGGKGKGGSGRGYTRAYKLSPALSELMGKDEMPRHEVVKRVWEIIKEKQLYDPNNRQFAICDDALYKVIGTKRFRTFGMMKYLKNHFIDD